MSASGLGKLLINEGLISEKNLKIIEKTCINVSYGVAKAVLTIGLLDEEELASLFVERTSYKRVSRNFKVPAIHKPSDFLPIPFLKKLEVVPYGLSVQRLDVVVLDPLDYSVLHQIEFFSSYKVRPHVATLSQLSELLVGFLGTFKAQQPKLYNFLKDFSLPSSKAFAIYESKYSPNSNKLEMSTSGLMPKEPDKDEIDIGDLSIEGEGRSNIEESAEEVNLADSLLSDVDKEVSDLDELENSFDKSIELEESEELTSGSEEVVSVGNLSDSINAKEDDISLAGESDSEEFDAASEGNVSRDDLGLFGDDGSDSEDIVSTGSEPLSKKEENSEEEVVDVVSPSSDNMPEESKEDILEFENTELGLDANSPEHESTPSPEVKQSVENLEADLVDEGLFESNEPPETQIEDIPQEKSIPVDVNSDLNLGELASFSENESSDKEIAEGNSVEESSLKESDNEENSGNLQALAESESLEEVSESRAGLELENEEPLLESQELEEPNLLSESTDENPDSGELFANEKNVPEEVKETENIIDTLDETLEQEAPSNELDMGENLEVNSPEEEPKNIPLEKSTPSTSKSTALEYPLSEMDNALKKINENLTKLMLGMDPDIKRSAATVFSKVIPNGLIVKVADGKIDPLVHWSEKSGEISTENLESSEHSFEFKPLLNENNEIEEESGWHNINIQDENNLTPEKDYVAAGCVDLDKKNGLYIVGDLKNEVKDHTGFEEISSKYLKCLKDKLVS